MASMYSREPCNNKSWTSHLSVLSPAFTFMSDREWSNNTISPLTPRRPWNSLGVYYKCVLHNKKQAAYVYITPYMFIWDICWLKFLEVCFTPGLCASVFVFLLCQSVTFTNTMSFQNHQRTCNCGIQLRLYKSVM